MYASAPPVPGVRQDYPSEGPRVAGIWSKIYTIVVA
jgi:hypothetical protein